MITGIGLGPDRSLEIVQAIIERWEILPSLPPATITLLGPPPVFEGGNSNVHNYGGDDCDGAGIPGLYVPVVGAIGDDGEAAAEDGIHGGPNDDGNGPDYESGPYIDVDTFVNLLDPANEPTLAAAIDPAWLDCQNILTMINDLRSFADVYCCNPPVCATPTACNLPDPPVPGTLIVIDGDYYIDPSGGVGTMLVTGELELHGRADWQGALLVFGEGALTHRGAGNGEVSGAIMLARVVGPDGMMYTADDCTDPDNGFGQVSFDMSGGGNAGTNYCSVDILTNRPIPPYEIVGFRLH
jgi:hypothetical protein